MTQEEKEQIYEAFMFLANCIEWGRITDVQDEVRQKIAFLLEDESSN